MLFIYFLLLTLYFFVCSSLHHTLLSLLHLLLLALSNYVKLLVDSVSFFFSLPYSYHKINLCLLVEAFQTLTRGYWYLSSIYWFYDLRSYKMGLLPLLNLAVTIWLYLANGMWVKVMLPPLGRSFYKLSHVSLCFLLPAMVTLQMMESL